MVGSSSYVGERGPLIFIAKWVIGRRLKGFLVIGLCIVIVLVQKVHSV